MKKVIPTLIAIVLSIGAQAATIVSLDGVTTIEHTLADPTDLWVRAHLRRCSLEGIPATVASLRSSDIPAISRGVLREAHPGYPVPRLLDQASFA